MSKNINNNNGGEGEKQQNSNNTSTNSGIQTAVVEALIDRPELNSIGRIKDSVATATLEQFNRVMSPQDAKTMALYVEGTKNNKLSENESRHMTAMMEQADFLTRLGVNYLVAPSFLTQAEYEILPIAEKRRALNLHVQLTGEMKSASVGVVGKMTPEVNKFKDLARGMIFKKQIEHQYQALKNANDTLYDGTLEQFSSLPQITRDRILEVKNSVQRSEVDPVVAKELVSRMIAQPLLTKLAVPGGVKEVKAVTTPTTAKLPDTSNDKTTATTSKETKKLAAKKKKEEEGRQRRERNDSKRQAKADMAKTTCFHCNQKGHRKADCPRILDDFSDYRDGGESDAGDGSSDDSTPSSSETLTAASSSNEKTDPCSFEKIALHDQKQLIIENFHDEDVVEMSFSGLFRANFPFIERICAVVATVSTIVDVVRSAADGHHIYEEVQKAGATAAKGEIVWPIPKWLDPKRYTVPEAILDSVAAASSLNEYADVNKNVEAFGKLKDAVKRTGTTVQSVARIAYTNGSWGKTLTKLIALCVIVPTVVTAIMAVDKKMYPRRIEYTRLHDTTFLPATRDLRPTTHKARPGFYADGQVSEYLVYDQPAGIIPFYAAMLKNQLHRREFVSMELVVACLDGRNTMQTLSHDKLFTAMQWRAAMEDRIYNDRYELASKHIVANSAKFAYHYTMSQRRGQPAVF